MKISRADIGTHILALVLALVLWFFVMYTQSPTGTIELSTRRFTAITLEARNRPAGLTLVRQPAAAVSVTVRGPRQVIEALTAQDVVAYLDLAGLKEGTHQLSVRVALPSGLEAVSIAPARVEIVLDQIISATVPVRLALVGNVAAGYFAPAGQVTPDSVVVTGGRSAVARLEPFIIRLDISGLTASLSASGELLPLDAAGQPVADVSLNVASVRYHQPIYPTKAVPIRLEVRGQTARGEKVVRVQIVPSAEYAGMQATLAGPPSVLQELSELIIPIDVTDIVADTTIEVTPSVPLGTYLVSPLLVSVRITIAPE
jgi:YbbR domain-containing protein